MAESVEIGISADAARAARAARAAQGLAATLEVSRSPIRYRWLNALIVGGAIIVWAYIAVAAVAVVIGIVWGATLVGDESGSGAKWGHYEGNVYVDADGDRCSVPDFATGDC